jgi:hypothetical protein
MIFLLEYDRKLGKLRDFKSFNDRAQAQRERLERELFLHRSLQPCEVVLLEAADEATLRRTHKRYFNTPRQLVESMMTNVFEKRYSYPSATENGRAQKARPFFILVFRNPETQFGLVRLRFNDPG